MYIISRLNAKCPIHVEKRHLRSSADSYVNMFHPSSCVGALILQLYKPLLMLRMHFLGATTSSRLLIPLIPSQWQGFPKKPTGMLDQERLLLRYSSNRL